MGESSHDHADAPGHVHDGDCCKDESCTGHAHGHDDKSHDHEHSHAGHAHEHEHANDDAPEDAPLPPISWKIVSLIYAFGCALCALFGGLHFFGIEQVKGIWLIFVFFPPCLLYSLLQYRRQASESALKKKEE